LSYDPAPSLTNSFEILTDPTESDSFAEITILYLLQGKIVAPELEEESEIQGILPSEPCCTTFIASTWTSKYSCDSQRDPGQGHHHQAGQLATDYDTG
jgi:hypothetical protein